MYIIKTNTSSMIFHSQPDVEHTLGGKRTAMQILSTRQNVFSLNVQLYIFQK